MKAKRSWLPSLPLVLAASAFVVSASVDPEPQPLAGEAAPERAEVTGKAQFDPQLVVHLQQLEAARRSARRQGLNDPKAWAEQRAQRAAKHREEIGILWGAIAGTIDGQAHLRLHANRMARLNRMLDLAEQKPDPALVTRVQAVIKRELVRHVRAMQVARVVVQ